MLNWFGIAFPWFLLAGAVWAIVTFHRNKHAGPAIRVASALAGLTLGAALGVIRYTPHPGLVVVGFPYGFAMFQLETAKWVVSPAPGLVGILNVGQVSGVVHALASAGIWLFWRRRMASVL